MALKFQVVTRYKLLDTQPDQWMWYLLDDQDGGDDGKGEYICSSIRDYETSDKCINAIKFVFQGLSYSIDLKGNDGNWNKDCIHVICM